MDDEYVRTTVYIERNLRDRMHDVDFNFSAWVNDCLRAMLDGSNEELMNLLNEERQHKARLAELKIKIGMIQSAPPDVNGKAMEEHEKKMAEDRKDELAHRITELKPDFFLSGKPFDKFTDKELEAAYKKLAPRTPGKKEEAPP